MAGPDWRKRALPMLAGAALGSALAAEVLALLLLRRRGRAEERFPFWTLAALLGLLGNALEGARRFVTASPSTRGVMLAGAGQGWDYCYSCQSHVPPRCGHCFSCNVCILRRDHHCTLLGQCLGYQNYRYFLGLLLHGAILLLCCAVLNADVVWTLLQEKPLAQTVLLLILPWLMLLTGQVNFTAFFFAMVTDACLVGCLFCAGFLLFHGLLVLRGQTTKEWFEGDRKYDIGWRGNLREILGERWHLALFTPFVASPLPGDGITFRTRPPKLEPLPKTRDL
nr:probable palmitoyltransferase ZDHHC24 [Anolis sagrei ordinatus]